MLVREQIKRLLYLALYAVYTRAKLFVLPLLIVPVVVIVLAATSQKQYTNHATILIEESALLNPYLDVCRSRLIYQIGWQLCVP